MYILIGPGIFHVAEVENLPESGIELNLGSSMLIAGVYQVTHEGERAWKGVIYPFYTTRSRLRNLPPGARMLPMVPLNC